MKKIYLLYIVLISLATTSLIGCSDWTESEAKTFPESIVSDGTPIYYTFESVDEFISFSQAMSLYVIETVQNGWKEKDSVDWTVFNIK